MVPGADPEAISETVPAAVPEADSAVDSETVPAVVPEADSAVVPAAVPETYDPAAPAPLGVERVPAGHPSVDAGLERLADADHLPADGHLEVYEDVHRGLREALAALDARPQPSPSYENRS
ncbi:hypothetical protein AMK26_30230 [Streptomyces sp. CB03234]|uniref:hypothetical protein n=1 Tax=Streptomyces sp. (strain CB03234) TaxID=1703937 RepID=UPI00093C595A|nr:hypothetical protein AMK26_30230 [Streptomyces sp. CB03234]